MNVTRAIASAVLLLGASIIVMSFGDRATDVVVIAGAVGVVVSACLMGLTALAVHWRGGAGHWHATAIDANPLDRTIPLIGAFRLPDEERAAPHQDESAAV